MTTLCWCGRCGTEHPEDARCPTETEPDGLETPVWRITVETPRGPQGYGVLVSAVGQRWRARILTYPNVMWTVPGGGSSIKFFGRTAEDAERQAVAFIRRHCAERSYLMRDELEPLDLGPGGPRVAAGARDVRFPRFDRRLPVRYGLNRPTLDGKTVNISESGLFVATRRPLIEGTLAGLLLELEHCKVPLRGSVVWNRIVPSFGRDAGMGLVLLQPPTIYLRYIKALG